MTQAWNCKAFLDRMLDEAWSTSSDSAMLARVIIWANEIQDEIVSLYPFDEMKFKLKKLLPTDQEFINLDIQKPVAPTVAAASGGSLTDGTTYRVYVTNVIYDADTKKYMESISSDASAEVSPTGANLTIDVSAIDTFDGDTSYKPDTIYRRVYMDLKASGETAFGAKLFVSEITDNTTTTLSITAESSSTISPPSDSEIDQISSDHLYFPASNNFLTRVDSNRLRRYDPDASESTTPRNFDLYGLYGIQLYPKLSSGATTGQRTLLYTVHRRPHEFFYDVTRLVDLPIIAKAALNKGVLWKIYEFRDRSGFQSKKVNYEEEKNQLKRRLMRGRMKPTVIRETSGDWAGFEA